MSTQSNLFSKDSPYLGYYYCSLEVLLLFSRSQSIKIDIRNKSIAIAHCYRLLSEIDNNRTQKTFLTIAID